MPPSIHEVLRSPGQQLDVASRAFFEPRFGHDFSQVRVHTDAKATESARAVNAVAYTVGRDVVFGHGQFAPHSAAGKRLLAHELAHTVQQRGAIMPSLEKLEVSSPDDHHERQAEHLAQSVVQATGYRSEKDGEPDEDPKSGFAASPVRVARLQRVISFITAPGTFTPAKLLSPKPSGAVRSARVLHAAPATRDLLSRAADEAAQALPGSLQAVLSDRVAADFSSVRVHAGAASAAAAEQLGARAYTLGRRIHLGAEASTLAAPERDRLLAHESVHAAQQGLSSARPHSGLQVGRPDSAAEAEARAIAASLTVPAGSASLAVRDRLRQPMPVRQQAEPQIQRDLKGPYKGIDGTFNLDLKTEAHAGAKSGMSGTIKFKASESAPDATSIRLLQIARAENLTTGKEHVWTGDEANRMKVITAAAPGVDPGFFVDVVHKNRSPRAAKGDAPVSPYYIDDYKALASPNNSDGSKKGKAITEASLWDYPGANANFRFSFETAAQTAGSGYVYATLTWGFTISDAAKGKVDAEHAKLNEFSSQTFDAAVKSFDEFYKNPGSSTAPK